MSSRRAAEAKRWAALLRRMAINDADGLFSG